METPPIIPVEAGPQEGVVIIEFPPTVKSFAVLPRPFCSIPVLSYTVTQYPIVFSSFAELFVNLTDHDISAPAKTGLGVITKIADIIYIIPGIIKIKVIIR